MKKEDVQELLEDWFSAKKSVVWEYSHSISKDLELLEKEYKEWQETLGLSGK